MLEKAGTGTGVGLGYLVEGVRCLASRMWPLAFRLDLGRCLRARSTVSPCQMVKRMSSMALHQVEGTGLNASCAGK